MHSAVPPVTTFIVRVSRDSAGRVRAQIERVSSGSKVQVDECDAIGPAIAQMLATAEILTPPTPQGDITSQQEPKS